MLTDRVAGPPHRREPNLAGSPGHAGYTRTSVALTETAWAWWVATPALGQAQCRGRGGSDLRESPINSAVPAGPMRPQRSEASIGDILEHIDEKLEQRPRVSVPLGRPLRGSMITQWWQGVGSAERYLHCFHSTAIGAGCPGRSRLRSTSGNSRPGLGGRDRRRFWAGPRHLVASRVVRQEVGAGRSLWSDRGSAPGRRPRRLAAPVVVHGCAASAGRAGASAAAEHHALHRRVGRDADYAAHSDASASSRQVPQRAPVGPARRARYVARAGRARHRVLDSDRLSGRSRPGHRHI